MNSAGFEKRLLAGTSVISLLLFAITSASSAFGWHDETHLAVAKAAGYYKWYNAAGADITKIKAGPIEKNNHYFDNNRNVEITPELVLEQARRYNDPDDNEGHICGAIIASLREYIETKEKGKYAEYHLAFCAHYIGDLSQPFHNIPYDDFNKSRHSFNDGIVENEVLKNIRKIKKYMYKIKLRPTHFEEDIAKEIAGIGNLARKLGYKLKKEERGLTKEEAYKQLGQSASLLRAVLQHLDSVKYPSYRLP